MSLKTLIEKLLPFLFKAAKREYDNLPKEEQDALKHGSGIVHVISIELDKGGAAIKELIKEKFPDLDEPTIEATIFQLAHLFNLFPEENNLDDAVAKIQAYLKTKEGGKWEGLTQSLANMAAIILAPATTVFAKVGMLMEYVYRKYVKK